MSHHQDDADRPDAPFRRGSTHSGTNSQAILFKPVLVKIAAKKTYASALHMKRNLRLSEDAPADLADLADLACLVGRLGVGLEYQKEKVHHRFWGGERGIVVAFRNRIKPWTASSFSWA